MQVEKQCKIKTINTSKTLNWSFFWYFPFLLDGFVQSEIVSAVLSQMIENDLIHTEEEAV